MRICLSRGYINADARETAATTTRLPISATAELRIKQDQLMSDNAWGCLTIICVVWAWAFAAWAYWKYVR
jgi:hypothetical protein